MTVELCVCLYICTVSIHVCYFLDSDAKPFQRKKKKPLAERIAEKEAAKLAKEVCTFL